LIKGRFAAFLFDMFLHLLYYWLVSEEAANHRGALGRNLTKNQKVEPNKTSPKGETRWYHDNNRP
jgi:hypothetical protein